MGLLGDVFNYTPLGMAYNHFYGDPAKKVEQAYDQQAGDSQGRAMRIRDFLMGQQQQALGYYKPVQGMFNNAYGSQGLKPMGVR